MFSYPVIGSIFHFFTIQLTRNIYYLVFVLHIVKQQNTLFILFVYSDKSFIAKYSLKINVI